MSQHLVVSENLMPEKLTSEQGREILQQIQKAMSASVYVKVPPKLIRPLKGQPRRTFNDARIEALAQSMSEAGQIMPGIIRSVEPDANGTIYELLDGERRLRAALYADLPIYRAMSVEISDRAAPYVVSVLSNFNREAHTTLELVDAIIKMQDVLNLTQFEIGKILGFSREAVSRFYSLRRLEPQVRDMLDPNLMPRKKPLPLNAAIRIATSLPPQYQFEVAQKVMKGEIKLVNLQNEVVKVAKSVGLLTREPKVEASVMRSRLLNKVDVLASTTDGLAKLLALPGMDLACNEYSVAHLLGMEAKLSGAAAVLVKLHERLQAVRSEKK